MLSNDHPNALYPDKIIRHKVYILKKNQNQRLTHNSSEYYNGTEEKEIIIEVGFEHRTNN